MTAPSRLKISALLATGYRFSCGFTKSGSFQATLYVTGSQAHKLGIGTKGVNLASAHGRIGPASHTVVLRVDRRYRAALSRASRISASLRVSVAGAPSSGNVSMSVTLVR